MHWLQEEMNKLHDLLERHQEYKQMDNAEVEGAKEAEKQTRENFFAAISGLVSDIADHRNVDACFACHEGLLVENSGRFKDFEALAAVGQNLIQSGIEATQSLNLGDMQQLVVVGSKKKMALFWVGEIGIGIIARKRTKLHELLSA